jgi:hypothetical protein
MHSLRTLSELGFHFFLVDAWDAAVAVQYWRLLSCCAHKRERPAWLVKGIGDPS